MGRSRVAGWGQERRGRPWQLSVSALAVALPPGSCQAPSCCLLLCHHLCWSFPFLNPSLSFSLATPPCIPCLVPQAPARLSSVRPPAACGCCATTKYIFLAILPPNTPPAPLSLPMHPMPCASGSGEIAAGVAAKCHTFPHFTAHCAPGSGTIAAGHLSDHLLLVAAFDAWQGAGISAAAATTATAAATAATGQGRQEGRQSASAMQDRGAKSEAAAARKAVAKRCCLDEAVLSQLQVCRVWDVEKECGCVWV